MTTLTIEGVPPPIGAAETSRCCRLAVHLMSCCSMIAVHVLFVVLSRVAALPAACLLPVALADAVKTLSFASQPAQSGICSSPHSSCDGDSLVIFRLSTYSTSCPAHRFHPIQKCRRS